MAKISPVAAKYIVHASLTIDGVVDRPDVIGAIFGQTEGLLGEDLELRELQKNGRIGRIEVNCDTTGGRTAGSIIIPSSLDKAETAIIAAAMEIIQRIGPCNAKILVKNIEDVRVSKRSFVIERAKELLKQLTENVLPDSQEIAEEVSHSVRMMECREFGADRLPAGPGLEESEEVIVVEGRADVLTLLKHGFKNVIAMNGSSVPQTIIDICRRKTVTAFVDGDRGGDLNIKELISVADIDFITKAPDGKEVEELTKKEIHKALRARISAEQAALEFGVTLKAGSPKTDQRPQQSQPYQQPSQQRPSQPFPPRREQQSSQPSSLPPQQQRVMMSPKMTQAAKPHATPRIMQKEVVEQRKLSDQEKTSFNKYLEDLIGTRGACLLDAKLAVLGKVPLSELEPTIQNLGEGVYAVILDGIIEKSLVETADASHVSVLIGMDTKAESTPRTSIFTADDF